MAESKAGLIFGTVVVIAAAGVGWIALQRKGAETVPSPTPAPVEGGGKIKPPRVKPSRPQVPPEDPIPATKEGCEAWLRRCAAEAKLPEGGGMIFLFPEIRMDALDAWQALDPAAAEPLILTALGGDGDPEDWSEERMHAALLRVRGGKPDGAETVKKFLQQGPDLVDADGLAGAARAASWMTPAEGGNVIRRILAEPTDNFDEEHLAAVLRAAAVLGDGASEAELKKFLAAEDGVFEWEVPVVGAAAGALRKLGSDAGGSMMKILAEDEWFDGEEAALGMGARGNSAVLPWLETMLTCEQEWTRTAAARALRVVGDGAAIPMLKKALDDPDSDVQAEAAISLLSFGDKSGLERVRKALDDGDYDIRGAAWRAVFEAADEGSREAAVKTLGVGVPGRKDPRHGPEARCRVWAAALLLRLGVK